MSHNESAARTHAAAEESRRDEHGPCSAPCPHFVKGNSLADPVSSMYHYSMAVMYLGFVVADNEDEAINGEANYSALYRYLRSNLAFNKQVIVEFLPPQLDANGVQLMCGEDHVTLLNDEGLNLAALASLARCFGFREAYHVDGSEYSSDASRRLDIFSCLEWVYNHQQVSHRVPNVFYRQPYGFSLAT